jgi:hypothetical protein
VSQVPPLLAYLLTQQAQQPPVAPPNLANLNLPTGPGQMTNAPLASATVPPVQAPGQQTPAFEQQQTPAQAGSPLAQNLAQNQAGPLGAGGGGGGAAGAAAAASGDAGMAAALPYLMALQYLQQQTAAQTPTIGGGRGGGFTPSMGGLF